MPDAVLRTEHLTKRYGATLALDDLDLAVAMATAVAGARNVHAKTRAQAQCLRAT